jgi:uncharacterized protein YijF (DUF1287 family)
MPETPPRRRGSIDLAAAAAGLILVISATSACREAAAAPAHATETCLGVADRGIWSDLDAQLQIDLPAGLAPDRVRATRDDRHHVLVLYVDGFPVKPYPLADDGTPARTGDRAELAAILPTAAVRDVAADDLARALGDRDGDGIPDPLDVLLGAAKTALNADAYTEGYVSIRYPNGDVPRTMGVCTDVIVRALRNAGLDIQKALHEDIARAPRAYPMVKGRGDPSIDQRRVATLLPYFERHLEPHTAALGDAKDPYRPGDILFMDTFPSRSGPDHIGIVSNHVDDRGLPLVINNWTNGTVTAEMDLLTFVPVTHRFRLVARP